MHCFYEQAAYSPTEKRIIGESTEMSWGGVAGGSLRALLKRSTGCVMRVAGNYFIVVPHIFCPRKHKKILPATHSEPLIFPKNADCAGMHNVQLSQCEYEMEENIVSKMCYKK